MRQLPYRVPQGYFSGLEARLSEIPSVQKESGVSRRSLLSKLAPYFTMAACFALALMVGKFLASRTELETEPESAEYSRYYEAGLFPVTRTYISPEDEDEMDVQEADDVSTTGNSPACVTPMALFATPGAGAMGMTGSAA